MLLRVFVQPHILAGPQLMAIPGREKNMQDTFSTHEPPQVGSKVQAKVIGPSEPFSWIASNP